MVEHVIALTAASHDGRAAEIAGSVAEDHRVDLVERCVSEGTADEVECVLRAETLAGIQECAPRR